MSEGRFISDTIEAVLVSMADSLREAQEALNDASPLDQFGRPVPSYQIPHLDFELGFRLSSNENSVGRKRLFFKPVNATSGSKEVTSKITGRFVAVPPGEGLPLPVLNANVSKTSQGDIKLTIIATNSVGENLTGVPIELNFDPEASKVLSIAAGVASPKLNNAVTFETAIPITDETGVAVTKIDLSAPLQKKAVVVVQAEIGKESVLIAFSKGGL